MFMLHLAAYISRPSIDLQSEVLFFRESAFIAGGVPLTVGADGAAFAEVRNGHLVRALLAAGEHEIFVQARSAEPTKLQVVARAGSTILDQYTETPVTYR